jgi:nicotinamidase-related amidase
MADFAVVPEHTALINVDMQNWFVGRAYNGLELLERINRLAEVCREAGIVVIHTSAVLRPDGSNMGIMGEMTPVVRKGVLNKGSETASLHRNLVIAPSDILLEKPRFGAFHGSDLEVILRSRGIDTLIISGISTQACCDTTAREAHARDFRVLFLSDGTAAADSDPKKAEEAHRLPSKFWAVCLHMC